MTKNPPKPNDAISRTPTGRFFDHAVRRAFDPQSFEPTFIPRLSWRSTYTTPGDPMTVVRVALDANHDIFLDTSAIDEYVPGEVWDLLLANKSAHLVGGVLRELEPWLQANPKYRMSTPVLERDRRLQLTPEKKLESSILDGAQFYLRLLVARKSVMSLVRAQMARNRGLDPSDDEVIEEVQRTLGERAYLLGRKNWKTPPDRRSNTDEQLVVIALAHALQTSRPTLILTRDQDVLEQFYKLVVLIDFDYRSMLIAERYLRDFASFSPRRSRLMTPSCGNCSKTRPTYQVRPDGVGRGAAQP
jgi:hypothetical protein